MSNAAKLAGAFAAALDIDVGSVTDDLEYNSIPEWDSVAHMGLVAELERVFQVLLDTDQIIEMSSVAKVKEILGKYGVTF
ncbi:MAG: acyl carrier protein [Deltaproteobacteria bacterium]